MMTTSEKVCTWLTTSREVRRCFYNEWKGL